MWPTKTSTRATGDVHYSSVEKEDMENHPLSRSSDEQSDNTRSEVCHNTWTPRQHSHRPSISANTTGIIALLFLYGLSILLAVLGTWAVQNRGNNLLKKTSAYSLVLDKLNIALVKTQIDSTLIPDPANPSHIYRMPPSPEVDAAWERIAHIGMQALTRQEVEAMGKNATECAKTPPEWGYGPEDHYMADVDVFHQLHCLNALRMTNILNYDYYYGSTWGYEPPVMFESHFNHCLDILRQNIMCNANVEMLTYNWRETQVNPFPDMAANKLCRDFDALVRWQEEVEVKDEPRWWDKLVQPEDAVKLPMPPHLDEMGATGVRHGVQVKKLKGITKTDGSGGLPMPGE